MVVSGNAEERCDEEIEQFVVLRLAGLDSHTRQRCALDRLVSFLRLNRVCQAHMRELP